MELSASGFVGYFADYNAVVKCNILAKCFNSIHDYSDMNTTDCVPNNVWPRMHNVLVLQVALRPYLLLALPV